MDNCEWYKDFIHYLQHMEAPYHLIDNEKISVKLHTIRYVIVNRSLWWRSFEGVLLKCIDHKELEKVLTYMHLGVCGGHYMAKTTAHKVMRVGF